MRFPALFLVSALIGFTTHIRADDDAIACAGEWSPAVTEQALIRMFGSDNVEQGMIYVGEGVEEPGTIVFPNDESKRVEIVWRDARKRRRPEWIRVPAGSDWASFAGIRNGMPLSVIETLNGRAFILNGFDWDYGGFVTDWRGGSLGKSGTPCRLQLRFERDVPETVTSAQQQALDDTSGDRELMSSAAAMRRLTIRVSEIIVQYPK